MTNQQRVHNYYFSMLRVDCPETFVAAPSSRRSISGFTLIEVLIYIVLLSFIVVASLGVTNQITQGIWKDNARIAIQSEADFVLRKLDYALGGVSPAQVTGGSTLSITAGSGFCFSLAGSVIMLKREPCQFASLTPQALTSANVSVSLLSFSINGAAMTSMFTMNGNTFQSTKYLR